ncbi:hypothetical protein F4859DRAFT_517845 [Xylaria cf. heliscus]|nr:hypothetical protein F4859DRAFT_517845 [Xylaria cf. heliscus]
MEGINSNNFAHVPQQAATGMSYPDFPATTGGTAIQGAVTPNGDSASDQMQLGNGNQLNTGDGAATQGKGKSRGRGAARSGGSGRGRGRGRGRGQANPRRRGGASRTTKRSRARRNVGGLEAQDESNDVATSAVQNPESNAPGDEKPQPSEVHRTKTSLRERLILGQLEPQDVGMRVYNTKKAAAAATEDTEAAEAAEAAAGSPGAPRDFLIPIDPRLDGMTLRHPPINTQNNTANINNAAYIQPSPYIAYKTTPMDQLHFPEGLVLELKKSMIKWEGKQHSEGLVFAVVHLINGDVADMHIFSTLREATADAIWIMMNEHPEAFALPSAVRDDGVEIKFEKHQRATSLIRDITGGSNFAQVLMPTAHNGQGYGSDFASSSQYTGTMGGSSIAHFDEGTPFFLIKEENSQTLRPSRFAGPRPDFNNRGELLLSDTPEPIYVFWGKFRIVSFGLKMETRRADGAVVKVSVHLKNLRRPAPTSTNQY